MKTSLLSIALVFAAFTMQAQNTNVTETSKTTVKTIKDSDGERKQVKQQNTAEVQNIELKDADGKSLNKEMKETPVQVTSVTQITNPDGTTRTVDVDRSAVYTSSNGKKYSVQLDALGYRVTSDQLKKPALLRRTSNNSYIYRANDKTSIAYFDTDGNIVMETYDDKSDKVSTEKFMKGN